MKANQPGLLARLKTLPWRKVPDHRATTTGHGRRATRTIKVIDTPAWTGFTGAAQVAQLRRTVNRNGKKILEVVYLITSADHTDAPPAVLASWIQEHWGLENRLHWVRDVTFHEDRSTVRTGNAPHVMASLHNTAIGLLRLTGWNNVAAGPRLVDGHMPDTGVRRERARWSPNGPRKAENPARPGGSVLVDGVSCWGGPA